MTYELDVVDYGFCSCAVFAKTWLVRERENVVSWLVREVKGRENVVSWLAREVKGRENDVSCVGLQLSWQ